MHVMLLPSWYPSRRNAVEGIFFRDQAVALAAAGLRVGVVSVEMESLRRLSPAALVDQHWQGSEEVHEGVLEVRRHGWSVKPRALARTLWVQQAIALAIAYTRRHGVPDLIHAHSAVWGGIAARRVSEKLGCPFVITEHRSNFLDEDWAPDALGEHQAAFHAAAGVAAVSGALARRVEVLAPGVRCEVIPNLVDTDFFAATATTPREPFTILSAGMLKPVKGFDVLIHAFATVLPRISAARLVICGDGPQRSALERLAKDLGVSEQIEFRGMVTRGGLRTAMSEASVFALASRRETFGVVLVEALAAGLPVIATRAGGPNDIVTSDVGWTARPLDVAGFADALACAHENYVRLDRKEISRTAERRFGRESVVARLLNFYGTASSPSPKAEQAGASAHDVTRHLAGPTSANLQRSTTR